jgi:hypothetical protein
VAGIQPDRIALQKYRLAMCAIAGVYHAAWQAARYRHFSQSAFPAAAFPVQFRGDGADRRRQRAPERIRP